MWNFIPRQCQLRVNTEARACSSLAKRLIALLFNKSLTLGVFPSDFKHAVVQVTCSVPQGSVLGPWMFIMYTADLEERIDEHGVNYHAYADDTRCRCEDTSTVIDILEHCITDVSQ